MTELETLKQMIRDDIEAEDRDAGDCVDYLHTLDAEVLGDLATKLEVTLEDDEPEHMFCIKIVWAVEDLMRKEEEV